ncbi:uncharacterized protein LOC126845990 isoform X2 [Adelges cooleyi]|nr:uncharacterized protein LOC126845990 isoform X2 [Adelges cooleyi]
MKLYCFLISFVFANISAFYDLTCYKRKVLVTNKTIELAYNMNNTIGDVETNGLEQVIQTIVDNEDKYCLGKMNLMIAVPEHIHIASTIPGLKPLNIKEKSTYYQCRMSLEIEHVLNIPVPQIIENQNFGDLDLTELAEERRRLTGTALKNIIRRALDFEYLINLIEERRVNPTGTVRNRITSASDSYAHGVCYQCTVLRMCRLIALFMSTKFPTSYIQNLETGSNRTCTIWDGNTHKTYRKVDGKWWQVSVNDINNKEQLLKEQLE